MKKEIQDFLLYKNTYSREEVEALLQSLGLITEDEMSMCHCYETRKNKEEKDNASKKS